jgi:hypothetical protein
MANISLKFRLTARTPPSYALCSVTALTKRLHDLAANVYLAAAGAIASVAAFGWIIYDKFSPKASDLAELIILLIVILMIGAIGYYSIRVRQENNALRRAIETIHKINHDYRDVLSKIFGGNPLPTQGRVLRKNEKFSSRSVNPLQKCSTRSPMPTAWLLSS